MSDPKSSFFASFSPWKTSQSSTPPQKPKSSEPEDDSAQLSSSGLDHTISLKPSPSLRRYPRDCPALKPRWYYAVDVPKRKPFAPEPSGDAAKPPAQPKKFVPFSVKDSQAIESAFQALDSGDVEGDDVDASRAPSARVPVNEDYLFDVHIEKRELEPAYWLGPVYEVRRGSWFYQESSTLRPCDENLANQLEEGYLKTAPWRKLRSAAPRAASQPRSRPTSAILEGIGVSPKGSPAQSDDERHPPKAATPEPPPSYRLFGAYMNTTVTYQDENTAYLSSDDLMSRIGSTVYGRFGALSGTKVVRGYRELGKTSDTATTKDSKRRSDNPDSAAGKAPDSETSPAPPRRSTLERQISSLAGMPTKGDSEAVDEEEEAREAEEKEMEAARETDGGEQGRKINHLILVTHGIGQRLGLRLDSINFVHDVNTMRKTMKVVYASAPDLQALSESPKNSGIQVLPICWRHLLDFPQQRRKQNRKEQDLGDNKDSMADDEYPSLQDITVEGVPYVRALTSDIVLDVLLYQSAYREHIAKIVQKEITRVLSLFKKRTGFSGTVSLCGHSLGSAILFDILCRQNDTPRNLSSRHRMSSHNSRDSGMKQQDLQLDFDCENFFCLGSPIALFQMLKGRTIAARPNNSAEPLPVSPFDPDSTIVDPFSKQIGSEHTPSALPPITASSPKCGQLYNVFHPTDPIAYRIEPLISPVMASLKPQDLPFTKKGLLSAPGFGSIYDRVEQQVMSSWYSLTSGVASSLINRSLGVTGEEKVLPQDKVRPGSSSAATAAATADGNGKMASPTPETAAKDGKRQQALANLAAKVDRDQVPPTLIDGEMETLYAGFQKRQRQTQTSTGADEPSGWEYEMEQERAQRLKREEAKVKALNANGRVDYAIQESMFDVSLLASIASHLSYWADEDVVHFVVSQTLKMGRREAKENRNSVAEGTRRESW